MNPSAELNNPRIVMSGTLGVLYITTRNMAKTIVKVPALKMTPILIFSPVEIRRFQISRMGMTMTVGMLGGWLWRTKNRGFT